MVENTKKSQLLAAASLVLLYYIAIFNNTKYVQQIPCWAFLIRIAVASFFIVAGKLYYITYHNKNIFDTAILVTCLLLYACLTYEHGYYTIDMYGNNYGTEAQKPFSLFYVLTAILSVILISKRIAACHDAKNTLSFIGKHSYHFMALHLLGFFILNLCIVLVSPGMSIHTITKVNSTFERISWLYFFLFSLFLLYGNTTYPVGTKKADFSEISIQMTKKHDAVIVHRHA